jgi:hypothetical protein
VYTFGIYEPKFLHGSSLSWKDAYQLLLRKSKFLRRVRGLARHIKEPNPFRLVLTDTCKKHCAEIDANMTEDDFNFIADERVRNCVKKLFRYVQCMKRAEELQNLFPAYFDPPQPGWFRLLCSMKRNLEKARIEHKTRMSCERHLIRMRNTYLAEGKKYGAVVKVTI